MTLQTVLMRLGGLSFGASHFTFAMVVAAFVACIALGSLCVSALLADSPAGDRPEPMAAGGSLPAALRAAREHPLLRPLCLRTLFSASPVGFYAYYASAFLGVAAPGRSRGDALGGGAPAALPPLAPRARSAGRRGRAPLRLEHPRVAARRAARRLRALLPARPARGLPDLGGEPGGRGRAAHPSGPAGPLAGAARRRSDSRVSWSSSCCSPGRRGGLPPGLFRLRGPELPDRYAGADALLRRRSCLRTRVPRRRSHRHGDGARAARRHRRLPPAR